VDVGRWRKVLRASFELRNAKVTQLELAIVPGEPGAWRKNHAKNTSS